MADKLSQVADLVRDKLGKLGHRSPSRAILVALLDIAYSASLRTEESSHVRGALTFAAPLEPDLNPPLTQRADYPTFTHFRRQERLTAESLVKLSRAIDNWSGALAVYGTRASNLAVWGVLDQRVHENISIHGEKLGGFANPGIVTIAIDGVAALTVTHGNLFLCALRQNDLVRRENDVFESPVLRDRICPFYSGAAEAIASILGQGVTGADVMSDLYDEWKKTITRLCISLRRCGTGGAFILSPAPAASDLKITHPLPYRRLRDALILKVLDERYQRECSETLRTACRDGSFSPEHVWALNLADADAQDREDELTGAVRLVASMATADGALLLSPTLELSGFGVKILTNRSVATVYDGHSFMATRRKALRLDVSKYGTRHGSMLRYCRADCRALGIIVSQDGQVRVITRERQSLLLWSNIRLLGFKHSLAEVARQEKRSRAYRDRRRSETTMGFSPMPKSVEALLSVRQ